MYKKALIDGDILLYRAAFSVESRGYYSLSTPPFFSSRKKDFESLEDVHYFTIVEPGDEKDAVYNYNSMLKSILKDTGTKDYSIFFTGQGNYRKEIYEDYKAGRPPRPLLYETVKAHALDDFLAEEIEGEEADDALGYNQTEDTIICSIDKDLLMIPGSHYHITKKEVTKVTRLEAIRSFYKQLLTGDTVDNIPGLKGIGPKKAEKMLEGCKTEEEMYRAVFYAYINNMRANLQVHDHMEQEAQELITRNGRLLWIRRTRDEMWEPPVDWRSL